jgi:hypothetical protein
MLPFLGLAGCLFAPLILIPALILGGIAELGQRAAPSRCRPRRQPVIIDGLEIKPGPGVQIFRVEPRQSLQLHINNKGRVRASVGRDPHPTQFKTTKGE